MRLLLAGLFFLLIPALEAQVERGYAPADLESGLLGQAVEKSPLDGNTILRLPESTDGVKLQDFAVCFALQITAPPTGKSRAPVLVLSNEGRPPWVTFFADARGISCVIEGQGPMRSIKPGKSLQSVRVHVVLNVKRDPRHALAGLWIDGIEQTSWVQPPGSISLMKTSFEKRGGPGQGELGELRIYGRALDRAEILELALPQPVDAGTGRIAVIGGTEAVAMVEEGSFEAGLIAAGTRGSDVAGPLANAALRVRNLAWESDTVFRRDRPLNFGPLDQQLRRVDASMVLLIFGRTECLERGLAGLEDFKQHLRKTIRACREHTSVVVVAGTPPFEKKAAPLPDLSVKNAELAAYQRALSEVAADEQAVFLDVSAHWSTDPTPFTTDGFNLNEAGTRTLGLLLGKLMFKTRNLEANDVAAPAAILRPLVHEKNRLWHDYWRPSNWAFLHGDRTAQPSSRDHLDPTKRWFPTELEQYQALIETKETELWKKADELGREVP